MHEPDFQKYFKRKKTRYHSETLSQLHKCNTCYWGNIYIHAESATLHLPAYPNCMQYKAPILRISAPPTFSTQSHSISFPTILGFKRLHIYKITTTKTFVVLLRVTLVLKVTLYFIHTLQKDFWFRLYFIMHG
jgi:hypothetical protein